MPINKKKIIIFFFSVLIGSITISLLEKKEIIYDFLHLNFLFGLKKSNSYQIKVSIKGCVKYPGVYCLKNGDSLRTLVERAGGFLPYAEDVYLNQKLLDGKDYVIPYRKLKQGEKININKASFEVLCAVPRINKSIALEIISYREKYERFDEVEELIEINGIGEKKFEFLKNYVIIGE